MKKFFALFLLTILVFSTAACASQSPNTCNHSYYLSDYKDASANANGYNEYICSECNNSYKEIIPAGSITVGDNNSEKSPVTNENNNSSANTVAPTTPPTTQPNATKPVAKEPVSTKPVATEPANTNPPSETTVTKPQPKDLFSMSLYSSSIHSSNFTFRPEAEDIAGWMHDNCYDIGNIHSDRNGQYYLRYDLNKAYTTLSGKVVMAETPYDINCAWLEFYDGNTLIHKTGMLSKSAYEIEYNIDVSNIQYLTIQFCATAGRVDIYLDDTLIK